MPERATTVMYPVFYQMVQGYSGFAGPPNKQYGPVSFMRQEDCEAAIATRPHPENYYCVRYESAKTVPWAPPPPTAPATQSPPADPASVAPTETKPAIQVGGKQYTKVAGLTWVESGQSTNSFADVSVGPTDLQIKDRPNYGEAGYRHKPTPPKPAPRGQVGYTPPQYAPHSRTT